jgi:hypothetical protein
LNISVNFPTTITAGTEDAFPSFQITDLQISANEVSVGENITIVAIVTNNSNTAGSYSVILRINDEVEETKEIQLDQSKSEEVTFIISRDIPGEYEVSIGSLVESFTVLGEVTPTSSLTTESEANGQISPIIIIMIVIAIVIAVGLIAFSIFKSRFKQR